MRVSTPRTPFVQFTEKKKTIKNKWITTNTVVAGENLLQHWLSSRFNFSIEIVEIISLRMKIMSGATWRSN